MSRILYVITKSNFGGAQRYVHDLAIAAKEAGHEVTVVTGGKGVPSDRLHDEGVRTISLTSLVQKRTFAGDLLAFGSLFTLIGIIRKERPDVVHVNSAKAGGLGSLAARLCGVRHVVFTAHGWEFKGERSRLSKAGIRFFSWLTMMLAHTTIAVSGAVEDAVKNWPLMKGRLYVIWNGIDDFKVETREKARAELHHAAPAVARAFSDPKAFVLGTIAELTPIKGLVYGLHAIDALPEELREHTYWIIMGEGAEQANLEKLITALGLEDRVFLAGFVPEARTLLKAFDLFFFPSLFEALGYAVLEAGHAGLPVVASRTGGIPEIITDRRDGLLVSPRDSFGYARAIATLAESHEMRAKLGSALKERVGAEFTREAMVKDTLAIYRLP